MWPSMGELLLLKCTLIGKVCGWESWTELWRPLTKRIACSKRFYLEFPFASVEFFLFFRKNEKPMRNCTLSFENNSLNYLYFLFDSIPSSNIQLMSLYFERYIQNKELTFLCSWAFTLIIPLLHVWSGLGSQSGADMWHIQ